MSLALVRASIVATRREPPAGYTVEQLDIIAAAVGKTRAELDVAALARFALHYREARRTDGARDVTLGAMRDRVMRAHGHVAKTLTALRDKVPPQEADALQRLLAAAGDDELLVVLERLCDVLQEAVAILKRGDDPVLVALRGFPSRNLGDDILLCEGAGLYQALTSAAPGFSTDPATSAVRGPFLRFLTALVDKI